MNIADTDIRKAVVHGVNKRPIIESELNEAYEPAEQLFPPTLPYCDVDLTPKFAYDAEKADWLCSDEGTTNDRGGGSKKKKKSSSNDDAGLIGGLIAAAVVALAALCCIGAMAKKEKEGRPVFAPVVQNPVSERAAEKA